MCRKTVTASWDGSPADLYCPACGSPVFVSEESPEPCKHLLFTWVGSAGDFGSVHPNLTDKVGRLAEVAEEEELHPVALVMMSIESTSAICICHETSGPAGMGDCAYAAFEFDPKKV